MLTLYYLKDEEQVILHPRYAFICPKRCGNPVKRNKIRRQFKESILKYLHRIDTRYSFIIMANQKCMSANFNDIDTAILNSLKKRNIIT